MGESDRIIILGDGRTDHMGKGATKSRSLQRKHAPERRSGNSVPTTLRGIANKARQSKKYKFQNLYHLLNLDFLRECFFELKKNAAPGVDQVDFHEYQVPSSVNFGPSPRNFRTLLEVACFEGFPSKWPVFLLGQYAKRSELLVVFRRGPHWFIAGWYLPRGYTFFNRYFRA